MDNIHQIDDTDLEIIDLLVENGRLSAAEIANRIGDVSERTVRNRLSSLFERKLIHIGALPDPTTMGMNVLADIAIQVEPGKVFEVAKLLADYENINYVACTTGETDISVQIGAKTVAELHAFVADTIGNLPGVRKTITTIIPIILKTFGYKTKDFDELAKKLNRPKRKS
ncbi:MAG: Lrp/AsnC family transcriptional regulator [Anaerolineales bacterium]